MLLPVLAAHAQETSPPLFRAGVSLVRIDAQVVGSNGQAMTNLTKDDFQVFDEGEPVVIQYFGRESEPLDVALLLDVSGSMHRSLDEMSRSARAALTGLHSGDRVSVMLFARKAVIEEEFTSDFARVEAGLRKAVDEKGLGSGTLMNWSIIQSAQELGRQPRRGRRAILIVTDSRGMSYQTTNEEVLRSLSEADSVLNAIVVDGAERPKPPRGAVNPDFITHDVWTLAERSGGEVLSGGKVGARFAQMIERIRSRYALQYPAPASSAGSYRRLRVELTEAARRKYPGSSVRARPGYYAGG